MMRCSRVSFCLWSVFILLFVMPLFAHSGPFDGREFKGRIAFSSDGNYNDEDDWGAFPVAVALLDAFGVTDKLVHVDYCNILPANDPRFYQEMVTSVEGAADRYGLDRTLLFNCQTDLDGAVESIKNAINASSADNPLYYVLAGPMEVPYQGIIKSDSDKRKHVYCISHSGWNDGYTRNDSRLHLHNKRDVIPSGINWIQCKDGNRNLAHPGGVGKRSTPEQWSLYHWLRDSKDERLNWIFTRLEAELRADISDSTMTYFLLTGDETADLDKLKSVLDDGKIPPIPQRRDTIRIEAENFRNLNGFKVEYGDKKASHRMCVALRNAETDSIKTTFRDIYATAGRYDIEIRYAVESEDQSLFRLFVNQIQKGDDLKVATGDGSWMTQTITDVALRPGDKITVKVQAKDGDKKVKLDYVQFRIFILSPR